MLLTLFSSIPSCLSTSSGALSPQTNFSITDANPNIFRKISPTLLNTNNSLEERSKFSPTHAMVLEAHQLPSTTFAHITVPCCFGNQWPLLFKSTNRKWSFPLESIPFQWIRWTPSERLSTPSSDMGGIFLSLSRIEMNFSIGIYPFPMDPMDSIGTTFHPLIQHEWNFSKSLANGKWTFPSESIRFQWIR